MKDKKLYRLLIGIGVILISVVAIVMSCIKLVDSGNILNNTKSSTKATSKTKKANPNNAPLESDTGIADAVEKLYNATVIVELFEKGELAGWGSGFVYGTSDKYAYILTNAHVVEDYEKVTIVYSDETSVEGTVLGYDTYGDIGVVRVPIESIKEVATLVTDDNKIRVGDTIFAIGTPVSLEYSFTVTRGILSGQNRMVEMSSNTYNGESWYMNLLQIDASINSGNSGGPLANANGEVVGITNSKLSTSISSYKSSTIENMGFAIPIQDAISIAKQIELNGKVTRPMLGVTMTEVKYASINNIVLSDEITEGAVVVQVKEGSVAANADIKPGDVIVAIDNYRIKDHKYLKYYLYRYQIGDVINITINRGGKEKKVLVTLK